MQLFCFIPQKHFSTEKVPQMIDKLNAYMPNGKQPQINEKQHVTYLYMRLFNEFCIIVIVLL